jgi:hypothetical protein
MRRGSVSCPSASSRESWPQPCPAPIAAWWEISPPRLDQHDVALLGNRVISLMTRDDLLDVILASRLPLLNDDLLIHLQYADRCTLQRLAHLGRRCCRNQGY